jgi:hypothetical protein
MTASARCVVMLIRRADNPSDVSQAADPSSIALSGDVEVRQRFF